MEPKAIHEVFPEELSDSFWHTIESQDLMITAVLCTSPLQENPGKIACKHEEKNQPDLLFNQHYLALRGIEPWDL